MDSKFHGVFPALLTPFDAQGKINFSALEALIERSLAAGCSGFYVCGSTSEAFLLSDAERMAIIECVTKCVNGRAAVIAHVGHIGTDMAVALARHAQSCGVDAISSVPPFYYGFSFAEIKGYYYALADAVQCPVMIYNFAANGGARLSRENFEEFLSDPRFLGVKHTSSDMYLLERLKKMREDVVVFNGFDEMFLSGLAAGADGGIGSTYNFMGAKFVEIERLFRSGNLAAAQREQIKANNIIEALLPVGVMAGAKAILTAEGIPMGDVRKPFRTPAPEEVARLLEVYRENV